MDYNHKKEKIESSLFEMRNDQLKNYLYGYFASLIISKKYAPNNPDLEKLMAKFGLEFRPYVYKSRTVLLSRVIRIIEKKEDEDLLLMLDNLFDFIKTFDNEVIEENGNTSSKTKKKKKKNIFDDIFDQLG
ncbi:hypothetical protein FEZ48_11195 [Marinilactibacillus psychrotolerans]|uniref:Uncharacterized protein n=1 Tax=Marinilactibacillus psychrotolerans TaxID=191770 RepID=A0A5R9C046_9LACT|nr:hypothetical protein [Marinilactibacillus psychrotolerans]TLQ06050.1 hypothetical protein FEZ48_11195 [Marinilactibacillus psychrotolerans]